MTFPDRLATNFELVKQVPSNKPFDVFLVKDRTKDLRPCVLRLLPASLSGDKAIVDAFMAYFSKFSEIINRAYIPTVYSVSGQPGGNVYVLEEHVSGTDLKKFIQKNRATSGFNKEIIGVVGKTCEAIHHAHQKDLFHLAITLEDILIDESAGRVKLVGFGVQVFAQVNKTGLLSDQAKKTIAPEVLEGGALRPNADIYSLAKAINEACPEVFSTTDVLSKALSNNPPDRYQQARDFEGALSDVLEKISKAARSRNIDTPLEAKGGLKPVLTEKPVTVEREVYQSPPRKPNTPQSQPQIKPDSVPVTPEPETPKSISMKLVAAIAAGVLAIVIGLAFYFSHEKQSLQKEREIAAQKDAQKIAALEKDRTDKDRQAAIEKERLEKELESARIKEAERLASIEKEKREKEKEIEQRKEAQRLADLYKERIERENSEKEQEIGRLKEAEQKAALEKERIARERLDMQAEIARRKEAQRLEDLYKERIERERREQEIALEKQRRENEAKQREIERLKEANRPDVGRWYVEKDYRGVCNVTLLKEKSAKSISGPFDKKEVADRSMAELCPKSAQQRTGQSEMELPSFARNYPDNVKNLLKMAIKGDVKSQFDLGLLFRTGTGVPKDYMKALDWMRKAADQNYSGAQYQLGDIYYSGLGVAQDLQEAEKWLRKAANQGNRGAEIMLSEVEQEIRWKIDGKQTMKWRDQETGVNYSVRPDGSIKVEGSNKDVINKIWRKLADKGYPTAQLHLGLRYRQGRDGFAKDEAEAKKWLLKAAKQGNETARRELTEMGVEFR